MKKILVLLCVMLLFFGFAGMANATLWDRGDGLIYDDVLDITWLQDANYGAGSSYDDGFYTTDGLMTWANARNWAENLDYEGYADWRLPTTPGTVSGGYTDEGEMGHMFLNNLGGTYGSFPEMDFIDGNGDSVSFLNLQGLTAYWTGKSDGAGSAWNYYFNFGWQDCMGKTGSYYAWAVRPGDVGPPPVPEPATMLLLGFGLVGLAGLRRKI